MKLRNESAWAQAKANNTDSYGACVMLFAEHWADLMERDMATGTPLAECAKATSHEADEKFGITGFMYGCAVSTLAHVWEHGEELRCWHNLDTQIRDEGEKANATGGVLNPALLVIG